MLFYGKIMVSFRFSLKQSFDVLCQAVAVRITTHEKLVKMARGLAFGVP